MIDLGKYSVHGASGLDLLDLLEVFLMDVRFLMVDLWLIFLVGSFGGFYYLYIT